MSTLTFLLLGLAAVEVPNVASDPFVVVEFYGFRITLLILFFVGLFKLVRDELRR